MAQTHINLQGNETRVAGRIRNLVDTTISLQDAMNRTKLILDECGAASTDWAAVSANTGLSQADAQAMYTLLTAARVKINSTDVDNFCNRLG